MARGTTLGQVVEDVRLELRQSSSPALGQNTRPAIVRAIQREQERLYDDWDWSFKRGRFDKTTAAGQRYYDVPTGLDLERIERVQMKWGTVWHDLWRGIDMLDYSIHDSDLDERADPVVKWGVIDTGSGEQIEFWPMPATSGDTIRFIGIKKLVKPTADSDTLVLDDVLVALFAAASLATEQEEAIKLGRLAQDRYGRLKGNLAKTNPTLSFAGGAEQTRQPRPPRVAYVRDA